ncbi:DUF1456 family protein [Geomonas sp. Red69]|uniref:DUF1456 family protein n=1 Tax=Geomonas diazotrophica TaxID=2843197 RepID=A0ABX8JPA4_9BACT|nr:MULTISPECIES: DUF1456 family protein [Geomonas]MBU5637215.1 DUF1456 family protein [Geomonas diazotrophica]QWV99509.1 DUF1456 family protein [Geomonas nitrogeniifigens]QXE88684.1 DUF1456 family protein [Geomonas nitrogeniifigens]
MTNNDVFRRLRYALNLNTQAVVEAFRLADMKMGQADITSLVKKDDEEGFRECSDEVLQAFLDGLIALKRGKREGGDDKATPPPAQLANNDVLKKIRIALSLKEEEMLAIFKLAKFPVSKSELSAVFRAKGQDNYKPCGDQMLRNFLKGLTMKYREGAQN